MENVALNPIALAVPFFFVLIGLELWVAWRRKVRVYSFGDALVSLCCGMAQQLTLLLFGVVLVLGYAVLYDHFRLFDLAPLGLAWTFPLAYLGVDFLYYWWHRVSHRSNLFWAAHLVHHQSDHYNLSTALRQGILTPLTSWPFYAPLAILGVPPLAFGLASALNTLYQFWIHTELVHSMGPVEKVLNAPSHHRVHHGVNAPYLDKNYASTFIVWDRWFGTYADEKEKPVYGLTTPLNSANVLWAQTHRLVELFQASLRAPSLGQALKLWIAPPEFHPPWASSSEPNGEPTPPAVEPGLIPYVALHFTLAVGGTFSVMMWGGGSSPSLLWLSVGLMLWAVLALPSLLHGASWAQKTELLRTTVTAITAAALFPVAPSVSIPLAVLISAANLWIFRAAVRGRLSARLDPF